VIVLVGPDTPGRDALMQVLVFVQLAPTDHPLRAIKRRVDVVLQKLSPLFDELYADIGRGSIPPEQLLKARVLTALYSVRSERLFCEQLGYNLLWLWLPLMIAIIGGETRRFRPLVDIYREYGRRAGHAPDKLKVGVHALGYVAETTQQAIDDFFPGYAKSFTRIGKERGWPPVTRAHFDAMRGEHGALLVGNPEEVAEKILRHAEALGGISRITFQMDVAELPQTKHLRSIELVGSRVAPALRQQVLTFS
jgi:Luciferase-like monooxygenase/Transposase domain (DUF772)